MAELTKLSETRWRYVTARRTYYIRQVKPPDDGAQEDGLYLVDGGGDDVHWVKSYSAERIVDELWQGRPLATLAAG